MSHAFISYSREDGVYAHRLAETLEEIGFLVWIDDRIDYGYAWPEVIEQSIDDCGAFIVIMSTQSEQSPWVKKELTLAQAKGKRIFPLLLEGSLWHTLAEIQYVDVQNKDLPPAKFFRELAKHVKQIFMDKPKSLCPTKKKFQRASKDKITYPRHKNPKFRSRLSKPKELTAPAHKVCVCIVMSSYNALDIITRRLMMVAPSAIFFENPYRESIDLREVEVIENRLDSYGYEGFGQYEAIFRGIAELPTDSYALSEWIEAVAPLIREKKIEYHPVRGKFEYSEWDSSGDLPNVAFDEVVGWDPYLPPFTPHRAIHQDDEIILRYPEFKPILKYKLPPANSTDLQTFVKWVVSYSKPFNSFPNSFASQVERLRTAYANDEVFSNCFQTVQSNIQKLIEPLKGKLTNENCEIAGWTLTIYGVVIRGGTLWFRGFTGELIAATSAYSEYLINKTLITLDDTYFFWEI